MKAASAVARPVAPSPLERVTEAFQSFTRIEGLSGMLLIAATIVALVWANSAWGDVYQRILETPFTIGFGGAFEITNPLIVWINDGLMAIFFFVVGLEIKREVLVGELSSLSQASLPIMAALGGMVFPAAIYLFFNAGTPTQDGWAIPMATDIAFALGILALVGKRAPIALTISLTALAIVDDLGAVLIIAIFYTEQLHTLYLFSGLLVFVLIFVYAWLGGRSVLVFTLAGILTWLLFFLSGVHATVAGVLVAMAIPVRTRIDAEGFLHWAQSLLDWFKESGGEQDEGAVLLNRRQRAAVYEIEAACQHVESPLARMEHSLHPWVAYVIMPIFAWANAGVVLTGMSLSHLVHPVALGIFFGLVLGKLIGVTGAVWLGVRLKWGVLSDDISARHVIGGGLLAGMGFTMSMFIAALAFGGGHGSHALLDSAAKMASPALLAAGGGASELLDIAKVAILLASVVSGVAGYLVLRSAPLVEDHAELVTPPDVVH